MRCKGERGWEKERRIGDSDKLREGIGAEDWCTRKEIRQRREETVKRGS